MTTQADTVPFPAEPTAVPGWMLERGSPLRLRLILLVAGTMLPLLMVTAAIAFMSYETARRDAEERVLDTTRGAMSVVDRELKNLVAGVEILALSPALNSGDVEGFREEATRFVSHFGGTSAILVANRAGQQLLNTNAPPGAPLPARANRENAEAVFGLKQPFVSNVFKGAVTQRPLTTVDVPVFKNGQVIYDLSFTPSRSIFVDMLAQLSLPKDWVISIFDRAGQHVARQPALPSDDITLGTESIRIAMAKRNEGIARTISLEGTPLLSAWTRSSDYGWVVAVGMPAQTIAVPARRALFISVGAGTLLVLIALGFVGYLATQAARAEADRELLVQELNHRVKNTLSTVHAIVSRSLKTAKTPEDAYLSIEARLMALSHAHTILSERKWESAGMHDVAGVILNPFRDQRCQRADFHGPPAALSPRTAITLAMVLNELVTNALKYGALTSSEGKVALAWQLTEDGRLRLEWTEAGGSSVRPPAQKGYGTQFIERAVTAELRGMVDMRFAASGFSCLLEIPL